MEVDNSFVIVMIILTLVGVIGTAVYYIARYSFKTDFDKDLERAQREALPESHPEELEIPKPSPSGEARRKETIESSSERAKPLLSQEIAPAPELEKTTPSVEPKSLQQALGNTKQSIWGRIRSLVGGGQKFSSQDIEAVEEILYTSDLGPQTVQKLMSAVGEKLSAENSADPEALRLALKNEIRDIFQSLPQGFSSLEEWTQHIEKAESPYVILVVGVNGAGKTTSIGKLAHWFASHSLKTLVAAGDTFRAAAGAQLKVWSERAQVEIFSPEGVSDPSAVAFDAVQKAQAKGFKVVIVDTAGRLHTQKNLMEELRKMKRVVQKVSPLAPHETLLVLDSNSGQNALIQARQFHEALEVSGVILTKLDGSAKGGVAVGIAHELQIPIQLIGVGEGIQDLRVFNSSEFVDSII